MATNDEVKAKEAEAMKAKEAADAEAKKLAESKADDEMKISAPIDEFDAEIEEEVRKKTREAIIAQRVAQNIAQLNEVTGAINTDNPYNLKPNERPSYSINGMLHSPNGINTGLRTEEHGFVAIPAHKENWKVEQMMNSEMES